jgi:hypothetical protein
MGADRLSSTAVVLVLPAKEFFSIFVSNLNVTASLHNDPVKKDNSSVVVCLSVATKIQAQKQCEDNVSKPNCSNVR